MDTDRLEAKKKIKNLPFKEKVKYYWGYYKIPFIVIVAFLLLVGSTVYEKVTEVKPDFEIMVFSKGIMGEDEELIIEEKIAEFAFSQKEDREYIVDAVAIQIPFGDITQAQKIEAGCMVLMAELSSKEKSAYILDENVYDYTIKNVDANEIWDEKYSLEIGENAKKELGLDENKKYYFLTQAVDEGEEEIQEKLIYNKEICKKLKELN